MSVVSQLKPGGQGRAVIPMRAGETTSTMVEINGRVRLKMLVDTGASMVSISRRTARELGIDVDSLPSASFQTANGKKQAWIGVLDEVRVQGLVARKVRCSISPDGALGTEGLLGQSFLGRFNVSMDARRGVMELSESK